MTITDRFAAAARAAGRLAHAMTHTTQVKGGVITQVSRAEQLAHSSPSLLVRWRAHCREMELAYPFGRPTNVRQAGRDYLLMSQPLATRGRAKRIWLRVTFWGVGLPLCLIGTVCAVAGRGPVSSTFTAFVLVTAGIYLLF